MAGVENEKEKKLAKGIASLTKKAKELSILCDIPVAFTVLNHGEAGAPIATWPSEGEAKERITRYLLVPEYERSKKLVTHEKYLDDKLKKACAHDKKVEETKLVLNELLKGKGKEISEIDARQLNDIDDAKQLKDMLKLIEVEMAEIKRKKDVMADQVEENVAVDDQIGASEVLPTSSIGRLINGQLSTNIVDFSDDDHDEKAAKRRMMKAPKTD